MIGNRSEIVDPVLNGKYMTQAARWGFPISDFLQTSRLAALVGLRLGYNSLLQMFTFLRNLYTVKRTFKVFEKL